jgi:hypothetical protein
MAAVREPIQACGGRPTAAFRPARAAYRTRLAPPGCRGATAMPSGIGKPGSRRDGFKARPD